MPRVQSCRTLLKVICATGLAAVVAAPGIAASRGGAGMVNVPDVYGYGTFFAFSGLDGKTSWAEPCVASTTPTGVGLQFHLPRDPSVKFGYSGAGATMRWRLASNDLLVADVTGDAQPLVIAMAAANVMVGRVPAGWRVWLEGGDAGSVLLRGVVGDRTQFAFAYSAKGAKEAATAAARGLKFSIDTLVEARTDFFENAPAPPEGTDRPRAKALAKAFSILKGNVYSPEESITVRWTTPDRWPQRDMGLWDSAFHSLGLMHLDIRLAKEALTAVYEFQAEDGFIPHRMAPGQKSEISQPPILAWAAWQVYNHDKMRDQAFLEKSFDVIQKHVTWFMKKRRLDGEPPANMPLEHGVPLYAWKSGDESGADNSPRFEGGAPFAAIDLSCYLANECWTLQTMAQKLGYRELAKTWGQRGDAIAEAARKQLWHGERGFFFDRKGPGGEWIDVWTFAGLLPLWSGVATREQAAKLKEHLVGKKFSTAMPVPSVARDDPKYKKDMWQGPTWININYLLVRGLQRYGYDAEAADLREKTLGSIAKWYGQTGCLYEFYDCDGQAPPANLDRKGRPAPGAGYPVVADYGWTAALYADLLLRPKP